MKNKFTSFLLAASMVAASGVAAWAQVPDAQTGTASPGRAEEQFMDRGHLLRDIPQVEVREMQIERAPEGAEKVQFPLEGLTLDGVHVYSENQLRSVYEDQIGTTITLADLYAIAAAITRKYRNDGYILTQVVVPPQTIQGGTARLLVVEGYIDNIEVRGENNVQADELIRIYASRIKTEDRALNVRELERALLTINDLAGVKARGILSPSPDQPGAADLLVIVERDPFDALLAIDNHGTRFLGPLQLTAAGALNSIFGRNERITGQVVMAPSSDIDPELFYVGLNYNQPIFDTGTSIDVFGSNTWTEPGYTLDQFDVEGRSQLLGAALNHPFIRTRRLTVTGRAAFDMRNIDSKNNIEATREDRIRAVRLSGHLEHLDNFFGVAFNTADLQLSQGLNILGATDESDLNVSRVGADANFTKLEAELQRLQRLSKDINLLMAASGQWASNNLFSAEEFGVGGLSYGRGFDPSEVIGDEGIAGKLELQWTEPYNLSLLEDYQLYSFFDAGRIWNDDPLTNSQKRDTLTSTGLGVRADFNDATSAGLLLAFPLNRDVQTQQDHDPRVYFNLNHRF